MEDVNISKYRAQVVRAGSTPASPGFVVSEGQDPVNPSGSSNYVPYSGAISNVDFGEFGLDTGFVTLDTTPTNIPTEQGGIYWDDARSTAALIMNGTLQHIGQDTFFYVKNSTGSSIAKGTAVRFDGTDGASGHLLIAPFLANGTYPSSYFMGVTAETIANGSFGQVMHFGELSGINTSGFTAGALLYASTSVAGGFQTTAPVAPNNIVLIAAAINSKNNGEILVRPTYGSNINTDEGIKITSVADKDLLQYQSGTGLWENKTLAQVIGTAYVPSTRTITINGTTQDLSANRTFNVGTVTSVGLSSATSGVTIGSTPVTTSGTITLAIATASGSQNGLLSSTDWTTFNNKQNALTNPVTGTGTTNYLPKFTGSTTIGNSIFTENGGNTLRIIAANASVRLDGSNDYLLQTVDADGRFRIYDQTAAIERLSLSTTGQFTFNFDNNNGLIFNRNTIGILGSIINSGSDILYQGTGTVFINADSNSDSTSTGRVIKFGNRGVEYMRLDASGNVGIGTASPGDRLSVITDGNTTLEIGSASTGLGARILSFDRVAGVSKDLKLTANLITFNTGAGVGSERMRITNAGNVGIGTDSPSQKLDVVGKFRVTDDIILAQTNGRIDYDNGVTGALRFYSTSTASERMRITSAGNLGIGTINATGQSADNRVIQIYGAGTANRAQIHFVNVNTGETATDGSFIGIDSSSELFIINRENAATVFENNGTQTLRITASGVIGFNGSSVVANAGLDKMSMGYLNSNYGWIQTWNSTPLVLNSSGNNVLIGTTTSGSSKLRIVGLPTSAVGLSSGDVWNDSGTLKIA